ncbi:DNA polymerase ligase N-terminal domain-containing protein [Streptomyces avermitilis]|uniref:DNA polymerase ligase N-terminal domain-containing protein n=1 Tax=Streptomyces avermitilis TaxID=33903 RepID=UPI0036D02610
MADKDPLRTYRDKRDFDRTKEPRGRPGAGEEEPRFVVQIHDASTMHFDFRLQVGDVLKSWSVPKGPSTDPGDKRLAVPTEDHPLEYEEFEGVIPEGEYGGGTVIVWDHGTYRPLSHDRRGRPVPFDEALERGHATFWLNGSKLRGEYALTRFRGGQDGGKGEAWLLVKLKCSLSQEFVVGGFTEPAGSRVGFGALLLGYYEDDRLRYAGKVGTGFDRRTLIGLRARLDELSIPEPPFADRVREARSRWVKPALVAQIAFTEWTRDGMLRHSRFLGLRDDKTARDVVRERPSPLTAE